jgi:hypothetical protein
MALKLFINSAVKKRKMISDARCDYFNANENREKCYEILRGIEDPEILEQARRALQIVVQNSPVVYLDDNEDNNDDNEDTDDE